jgi:hypothetical protein
MPVSDTIRTTYALPGMVYRKIESEVLPPTDVCALAIEYARGGEGR